MKPEKGPSAHAGMEREPIMKFVLIMLKKWGVFPWSTWGVGTHEIKWCPKPLKPSIISILLALLFVIHTAAPAESFFLECIPKTGIQFAGQALSVCYSKRWNALISSDCASRGKCGSLALLTQLKTQPLIKKEILKRWKGNSHPSAFLCTQLQGVVEIATTYSKSELTFCRTQDGSRIETEALMQN